MIIEGEPCTMNINLDQIKNWNFEYKKKIYRLDIKEILRLLELVKDDSKLD